MPRSKRNQEAAADTSPMPGLKEVNLVRLAQPSQCLCGNRNWSHIVLCPHSVAEMRWCGVLGEQVSTLSVNAVAGGCIKEPIRRTESPDAPPKSDGGRVGRRGIEDVAIQPVGHPGNGF